MKMNDNYTHKDSFDRKRHGSLYDRGLADSHYNRLPDPHWYPNGTYNEPKIADLTPEQVTEYNAGFDDDARDPFSSRSGKFKRDPKAVKSFVARW